MSRFITRQSSGTLFARAASTLTLAGCLALASLMCAPQRTPSDAESTAPAQASATAARRTAVAGVQRILSGDLEPTPTPDTTPTPTPRPVCQDAIWWYEARAHIGESRIIQGTILRTRPAPDATVLLELGQPYPDPTGFAVIVPAAGAPRFATGQTLCVQGRLLSVRGLPTIIERDPATIKVLD